jgi:ADP-heptose:LPS heptosyltransferase
MLLFKKTYQLQFKYIIPNYIPVYIANTKFSKRVIKFLKRYLYIILKRQKNLEIFKILPEHKKILWINVSAPSLGDSLMDLSSRILLKDRSLDLYTDKKNASIYDDDNFFNNIFTEINDLKKFDYDLIIIDSFSSRSIKIKSQVAPKTIFVGIYGYFNGPEVNRILYSFHQMNYLLGYIKNENEINGLAKNSIFISKKDQETVKNIVPKKYIVIGVGGEWQYKTYNKWDKVINQLTLYDKDLSIIFVGSHNATKISKDLLNQFPENLFLNFTSRLSFNQTAEVIRRSEAFLCCDGGLMHAAIALNVNIVPLFARLTAEMLVVKGFEFYTLFDSHDVNNIKVNDILLKYYDVVNPAYNHLRDE